MTVKEISKLTGSKYRNIQALCQQLGCRKFVSPDGRGMYYDLTDGQVKKLISRLGVHPGRPRGEQPWVALGITRQAYWLRMKKKRGDDTKGER